MRRTAWPSGRGVAVRARLEATATASIVAQGFEADGERGYRPGPHGAEPRVEIAIRDATG